MIRILLLLLYVQISSQEVQSDCQAGQFFHQSQCKGCDRICFELENYCESGTGKYYYSSDGADVCTECSQGLCMCDTTSPLHLASNNDEVIKACEINGTVDCNMKCYTKARHASSGLNLGRISEQVRILDCSCEDNRKTKDSCLKRKNFTKTCLRNECDADGTKGRYYDDGKNIATLNADLSSVLKSCYSDYSANKSCSRSKCVEALSPYLTNLTTCNCFHTYKYNEERTSDTKDCEDRRDFYKQLDKICTEVPIDRKTINTIIIVVSIFVTVFTLVLLRWCLVKYLRHLKRSGKLGRLIRYIDWDKVKPLGAAAVVLQGGGARNPDVLHNKEILVKVRFSLLGGTVVRPQHVVLKIFSDCQSEQQGVELGIINSITDKKMAKKCNIISVYGPTIDADNSDLVKFLDTLVKKSKTFQALQGVIERNYLGRTGDAQDSENPRCKYIAMNHCNELSLSKFIKTGSHQLTLDMVKKLCVDLATALQFLHEVNKPSIVHCDIKPDNVFVKSRHMKTSFILGDFGFAEKYENQVFTLKGSTPSYVPPEWYLLHLYHQNDGGNLDERQRAILGMRGGFPHKIDIYAYGLVVWLALHKRTEPWTEEFSRHWREAQLSSRITREAFLKRLFNDPSTFEVRPVCEDDASNQNKDYRLLLILAEDCWQTDCSKRPTASQILCRDILKSGTSRTQRHQHITSVQHHHVNGDVQPEVEV